MKKVGWAGILSILMAYTATLSAETAAPPFFATVERITETNSVIVTLENGKRRQVVLAFLSIPRPPQPYAARARQVLEAQLLGRSVSIRPIGPPKPEYTVGVLYVGNQNFNLDFLRRGHAWVDYQQPSNPEWLKAQQRAREGSRGLYAYPDAAHPIQWAEEFKVAEKALSTAQTMGQDVIFRDFLDSAYVGHRDRKEFVSASCLTAWLTWPRQQLVAFTRLAGAEDDNYVQIPCPGQ